MYNHVLRGLILNSGMTQKQFADKLGIMTSTISNIITDRRGINIKHKKVIADYFNKPINSLFKGVKNGNRKGKRRCSGGSTKRKG